MTKWFEKNGPEGDVVISTRIRFARNLKSLPFPCKLKQSDKEKVNDQVIDAVLNGNMALSSRFKVIDIKSIPKYEAISLVEKHIISPQFASDNIDSRKLLLLDDYSISIMLNEEDHIRLQVMKEGLNFDEAYDIADKLDTYLDERLSFAFDDRLGYLTQCPTNLGTGMRASLQLHLPALEDSGAMDRISLSLSKLGLTLRGFYGEGTKPRGSMYQLSNQVTLGLSERLAINNLRDIAMQLIKQERAARFNIANNIELLDAIGRSYGILLNCKTLSNEEFLKLISNVRLGVSINEIKDVSFETINKLIIDVQPATLMMKENGSLSTDQRRRLRAEIVKDRLAKK